jgi:uncharacterized cupredoxin-like copper-binding protein
MKYARLCVLVLGFLLLATLAACGGGTQPVGAQTVTIDEGDSFIHASQTSFTTGVPYHFVVTNNGTFTHDLLIMHPMNTVLMVMDDVYAHALASIEEIAPGQTSTLAFVFTHTAPVGMLELSDHYAGQYQNGMHEGIVVTAASGSTATPYPNNGIPASAAISSIPSNHGPCDPVVTVTIGANGAYEQQSVSIKQGDTLTIVNTTQQSFTLTTQPNADIRYTIVDPGETEHVPFPLAGTFLLSSLEHPSDTLTVHVSNSPGVTCGFIPSATVSFTADASNHYFVTPTSVTINEGQSIILSNLTSLSDLKFASQPDAGLGNPELDANEHQFLLFADDGTYTISCVNFPAIQFTVHVLDD